MRKKYSGLSTKVLKRKKARREELINTILLNSLLVVLLSSMVFACYKLHKVDAPTWADFKPMKLGDTNYEVVDGSSLSGAPTELTINGERWSLVLINHFDGVDMSKMAVADPRMAQTDCTHRTISYIATSDSARLKINLMHEVYHAGACLHGGDTWWNSPKEEVTTDPHPGIYHLGEFTATFLHDNPRFASWEAQ